MAEGGRYFNENKSRNVQATAVKYSHFQETFFTIWSVTTAASFPFKMRTLTSFYKSIVYTHNVLRLVFRQVRDVYVCRCVCRCVGLCVCVCVSVCV